MIAEQVCGDHREQGFQLGQIQREAIASFLEDGLCRLHDLSDQKWSVADLRPLIRAHGEVISREAPKAYQLIEGLAEGSGISLDEALLLQLRREVVGYSHVPTRGECTSFVTRVGTSLVGAQTIDLNGCLDDHMRVVRYVNPHGRSILMLTYTGLLGFIGLNDQGVAVLINLVVGGHWQPGIPPYLVVRELLEEPTLESAKARLRDLPFASSRALTLLDANSHVNVEVCGHTRIEATRPWALHTNHYLAEELVPEDALNVFARSDSRKRLKSALALLEGLDPDADAESLFALMSFHGTGKEQGTICVHNDSRDRRADNTVAAAVLYPSKHEMHVRIGPTCRSGTTVVPVGSRCRDQMGA